MSDADTLRSSLESSRPLEVYTFALGGTSFRYTSAEDSIVLSGDTFEPESISRNSTALGSDSKSRDLLITVPSSNEFAEKYVNLVPGQKATVTIIELQRDEVPTFDTETLVFKGQVQSVHFPLDGHGAEIIVRSIEVALNRTVPRFTYMATCNHVLYDQRCKVISSLFDLTGAVTAEIGNTITVTGATIEPDGFYTGGFCKPVGVPDFRMILAHSGNVLTLLLPFSAPVISTDVQIFAGCDHVLTGDCANKFENADEFGGTAFVPNKNIFESGLD